MNKKQLALKILLPVLVVLIAVLVTLEIKCLEWNNDSENGLVFVVSLLLNIIPMIAIIILGLATLIISVLLFTIKNKRPLIIGAIVILSLLLPFICFSVFVDITALYIFIEVPIIAIIVLGFNIAALVLSCIEIRKTKNTISK